MWGQPPSAVCRAEHGEAVSPYCCCCGGPLLGGFDVPNPPVVGWFGLFCNPAGAEPVPRLLLPPFCPLMFCTPCCPNNCSRGWYGVVMMKPRSSAGSYTNCHSLYFFL